MNIYKKMYLNLFNQVTDSIALLQKAQQEAEETYISGDDEITLSPEALALIRDKSNGKDLSDFLNETIIKTLA